MRGPGSDAADPVLYTVGHSNHAWPAFLALLQRHGVNAVADVRSQPTSRFSQYRRPALDRALAKAGIAYLFLGRELGARRDEAECYDDGCADYERIARLPAFLAGIERVLQESERGRLALLCAEKEPLDCHRTILICRQLRERPIAIRHILASGEVESHFETEQRLIRRMGVSRTLLEPDLSDEERLRRAYDARGLQIAYRQPVGLTAHAAAR